MDRKIPAIVLRLLLNMYLKHSTRVTWNGFLSADFAVENGVKQGGILSPILFCVYMDVLLNRLQDARIGCHMGRTYLAALAYADDLTLLAPTAESMRTMLHICNEFATEFSVSFNVKKTKCMLFKPHSKAQFDYRPVFYVDGKAIEYVHQWPHLGNILDDLQDDSACISFRRNKLIGQANDVICYFGKLNEFVQTSLL